MTGPSMMPSRVLYVGPSGQIGGGERSLLGLLAAIDRQRYLPLVAAPEGPFGRCVEALGIRCLPLELPAGLERMSLRGQRPRLLAIPGAVAGARLYFRALHDHIAKCQPHIIHANGIKPDIFAAFVGRRRRIPVVWHVRDFLGSGLWERLIAAVGRRHAARVIANSEAVGDCLRRLGIQENLQVIPTGVDLDRFSPRLDGHRFRQELGLADKAKLVGLIAHLTPWKGQDIFLRAAALVRQQQPLTHFVLVGDEIYRTAGHGGFRQALQRIVEECGLEGAVTFAGFREGIPEILAAFDLSVHASVNPEPFGRAILEAMAMGKAVVATLGGGAPEVLGPTGRAGLLVPPGDATAMSQAILELLGDPSRRASMGAAGRHRAEALFDIRTHGAQVCSLYDDLRRVS